MFMLYIYIMKFFKRTSITGLIPLLSDCMEMLCFSKQSEGYQEA